MEAAGKKYYDLDDKEIEKFFNSFLLDPSRVCDGSSFNWIKQRFVGSDGLHGLARFLDTSEDRGISLDSIESRKESFGVVDSQGPEYGSFIEHVQRSCTDMTTLALFIVSVICGIVDYYWPMSEDLEEFKESLGIIAFLFFMVLVYAVIGFLNDKRLKTVLFRPDRVFKVIREGKNQIIAEEDLLVGDLVEVVVGDLVLFDAFAVKSESFVVHCCLCNQENKRMEIDRSSAPFLLSGSEVTQGWARVIVLAVGNSTCLNKKIGKSVQGENEIFYLQGKLNLHLEKVGKYGLIASFVIFVLCFVIKVYYVYMAGISFIGIFCAFLKSLIVVIALIMLCIPETLGSGLALILPDVMKKIPKNVIQDPVVLEMISDIDAICIDLKLIFGLEVKLDKRQSFRDSERFKELRQKIIELIKSGKYLILYTDDELIDNEFKDFYSWILGQDEISEEDNNIFISSKEFIQKVVKTIDSNEKPIFNHLILNSIIKKPKILTSISSNEKFLLIKSLKSQNLKIAFNTNEISDLQSIALSDILISNKLNSSKTLQAISDIVLPENDFLTLTQIINQGHYLNQTLSKIIQFQMVLTSLSFVIYFLQLILFQNLIVAPVHLLWLILINDIIIIFACSGGEIDFNMNEGKSIKSFGLSDPEVAKSVKNKILTQGSVLILVLLSIYYRKIDFIFEGVNEKQNIICEDYQKCKELDYLFFTFVFQVFTVMQIFNLIGCTRIVSYKLKEFHFNWQFILVFIMTIVTQFFIVKYGGKYLRTSDLGSEVIFITLALGLSTFLLQSLKSKLISKSR